MSLSKKFGILAFLVGVCIALLVFTDRGFAQGESVIGYALLTEDQKLEDKTYTLGFEVWSNDRDAQELSVVGKSDSENLEVLTQKKQWRGKIKKGKRYQHSITVKNKGTETYPLVLEIKRRSDKRTDTKTVTILVAPQ